MLVDARHGLKSADAEVLDLLDEAAVSYEIVLTKCDEVKADALTATSDQVAAAGRARPAAYPDVLTTTSTRSGAGIPELRAAVARLLEEKA